MITMAANVKLLHEIMVDVLTELQRAGTMVEIEGDQLEDEAA